MHMGLQFVLIHGAWHHGGHWKEVIRELELAGHKAYAPTLLGNEPGAERINYSLKDRIQHLRDDIVKKNLTDFVLVAHSAGGPYAQELVQLEPHRVRQVVFVSAFILKDGENIRMFCLDNRLGIPQHERVDRSPENFLFPSKLPLEWWHKAFAHTVDPEMRKALHATLVSQGGQAFSECHDLKAFYQLKTPMTYIHITNDFLPGLPGMKFGEGWHPGFSSRLGTNFRVVKVDGDHEVMLTAPASLAQTLIVASTEWQQPHPVIKNPKIVDELEPQDIFVNNVIGP
ncbi:hypothetical protein MPTK1_7g09830 [Marchantia polymorpha subsp. ruderalis]|uniref:AB hydrolase-1 domain-containing protein n=2 Tax=Marchantia polymorpha TaxID=3197 RepID=A0AAF6BXW8_MARPO|nr:hypothetical protein MARPO_0003s0003 [Marchantia polymorpha]BBN16852.1 hypothetical protein Mp_7g09830 [Marchantia polymorpha subsp. ruderalis]|eukprot:PTQ49092.1 hypothetical protein MARPO_0003s0003 [Marchantia polymorpha]